MAQANTLSRETVAFIGEETALGTSPAGAWPNAYDVLMTSSRLADGLTQETLDNTDPALRRTGLVPKVQGLKTGSTAKLSTYVKPVLAANFLKVGGAVATLSHRLLYRHLFGCEYAGLGTAIGAGASTTVFTPAAVATYRKGTWILVSETAVSVPEPCRIDDVGVADLTVSPPLPFTPTAVSLIRGMYSYAPAEAKGGTLALRQAVVTDLNAQCELLGCFGGGKLTLPAFGKLATLDLDLKVTTWSRGALAYVITAQADDMGAPVVFAPKIYLVKRTVAATRAAIVRATRYVCESISLEMPVAFEPVLDGGGVGCMASVVDCAGRPGPTITVKARFDGDAADGPEAYFTAGTELEFVAYQQLGGTSFLTAPFMVLDGPRCRIEDKPKRVQVGSREGHEFTLHCYPDDVAGLGAGAMLLGANDDPVYAPVRWAIG